MFLNNNLFKKIETSFLYMKSEAGNILKLAPWESFIGPDFSSFYMLLWSVHLGVIHRKHSTWSLEDYNV